MGNCKDCDQRAAFEARGILLEKARSDLLFTDLKMDMTVDGMLYAQARAKAAEMEAAELREEVQLKRRRAGSDNNCETILIASVREQERRAEAAEKDALEEQGRRMKAEADLERAKLDMEELKRRLGLFQLALDAAHTLLEVTCCTHREGGDVRLCTDAAPCLMCRLETAEKRAKELEEILKQKEEEKP